MCLACQVVEEPHVSDILAFDALPSEVQRIARAVLLHQAREDVDGEVRLECQEHFNAVFGDKIEPALEAAKKAVARLAYAHDKSNAREDRRRARLEGEGQAEKVVRLLGAIKRDLV